MIRIILRGRTGNILFQYALGRVLSAKHGVPLVMDASWYNRAGWSEISHFLRLPIKAGVNRGGPPGSIASRTLRRLAKKHYWEFRHLPVLRENPSDQSFDPLFLAAPADCVLYGYFQTPRYFESREDELRSEFIQLLRGCYEIAPGQTHPQADIFENLRSPNSVAVHVRRGDFLMIPLFNVCDESYYHRSMDEIRARMSDARFFIFSDDPEWCRSMFNELDCQVMAGGAGDNPLHDLYLMSLAAHHIIANSSYSWWAAWIGEKAGQIVLMPDRWYADGTIHAPIEEKRGGEHWICLNR